MKVSVLTTSLLATLQEHRTDDGDDMQEDLRLQEEYFASFTQQDAMYPGSMWKDLSTAQRPATCLVGSWAGPDFRNVQFSQHLLQERLPGSDGSVAVGATVNRGEGRCTPSAFVHRSNM